MEKAVQQWKRLLLEVICFKQKVGLCILYPPQGCILLSLCFSSLTSSSLALLLLFCPFPLYQLSFESHLLTISPDSLFWLSYQSIILVLLHLVDHCMASGCGSNSANGMTLALDSLSNQVSCGFLILGNRAVFDRLWIDWIGQHCVQMANKAMRVEQRTSTIAGMISTWCACMTCRGVKRWSSHA